MRYKTDDIVWVKQSSHFSMQFDYKLPARITYADYEAEDENCDQYVAIGWVTVEGFEDDDIDDNRILGFAPDNLAKAFRETEATATKFYELLDSLTEGGA